MRTIAIALLVACSSCAAMRPDTPDAAGPSPVNAELAAPDGAWIAQDFAIAEWTRRLGPPAPNPKDTPPRVRWFKGIARASDGKCCYLEYEDLREARLGPVQVYSIYWPYAAAIHVAVLPPGRPSDSGLAHELLHFVLASSGRNADNGHALPIWKQVREVNELLLGKGL